MLVLSKQVPMGIGAILGGGGNHVFARLTVKSSAKIFGPPPAAWSDGQLNDRNRSEIDVRSIDQHPISDVEDDRASR